MRPVDFEAVKRLVSIDQVLAQLGWRHATVEGLNRRGPCPVHGSRDPRSRNFAAGPNGWYCHTCKRGGDQIRLLAEIRLMTEPEAAVEMCRWAAVEVPFLPRRPRKPRAPRNREEER